MRSLSLLVTLALVTSCQPMPGATEPSPAGSRSVSAAWARVNSLRGYLVHGIASGDGRIYLAGEQIGYGGVVLMSGDGGKSLQSVIAVPDALHLYTIRYVGSRIWAAGETRAGRALLMESSDRGKTWSRPELPQDADAITALAVTRGRVFAAVRSGMDAALLAGDGNAVNWSVLARMQASGLPARLTVAGAQDARVVFAGTDGSRAVLLESDDGGLRFAPGVGLEGLGAVTSSSFQPTGRLVLGGYIQQGAPEQRRGILLREGSAGGWDQTQPAGCVTILDVLAARGGVYIACATGHGDSLLRSDGSASWEKVALPQDSTPVILERLALVEGHVVAVGGSGLYQGPS